MKTVDLFCGCGGLSLGFQQAGYKIALGIDSWSKAIDIYKKNFDHDAIIEDLSKEEKLIPLIKKINPDLIIGGPPCQDFSIAGKRDETKGRADLTYNFTKYICETLPSFFVMENVSRIQKSNILEKIINKFKNYKYGITKIVLNAAYCGVPQSRNRFFLIGHLNGKDEAVTPFILSYLSSQKMTIKDYFGDSLDIEYYYRHPRSYSRRGIFSIYEPSPTIRGVNRPVPPNYKKHSGDAEKANLKELRPLTTIERSYIQTFPKEFIFEGSKTDLEQMIGNAVPVNLAKLVALSLRDYILHLKGIELS